MATESLPPPRHNSMEGIALRLGAGACFSVMAALIKLAHDAGASTPELVFYRNLLGLVPLLLWIGWSGNFGAWRTKRPGAHLTRGLLGLMAMSASFGAVALLPLAEVVTLSFVAPLFAVALSAMILKEVVGRYRWTAVAIGFAGVFIVMQPAGSALSPLGLALALVGAMGVAAVTITIRQMSRTESTQTTVLWFTSFAVVASGLMMPAFAQAHDGRVWAMLVGVGLAGGVGQLCLTGSLRAAPIAVVVPFDYTQLIWAVLLGWLIWSTEPQLTTWIGAAVIVGSGLYTLYREQKLGRTKPPAEPL